MASERRSNARYAFSGHQTFPFRYPWLPKGVQLLLERPDLFTRDDAFVILGVGKNMVRSIRHWCIATGVFDRVDHRGTVQVSKLGRALLDRGGWDPYLEDPGTLWLLHWRLVSRPSPASTWHLAFTRWNTDGFAREDLAGWLLDFTGGSSGAQTTRTSLRRDVDVFLRTYVPSQAKGWARSAEDTFDCPLVELGLLVQEAERGPYRFVRGPKPTLPEEIFAYALLEYWTDSAREGRTLSFETLLHGAGSPGGAFQLSENALSERLEHLPEWTGLSYDDTAGMRTVRRREGARDPEPMEALSRYYGVQLHVEGYEREMQGVV
jgi:Protein of unknown function (DUF4007)